MEVDQKIGQGQDAEYQPPGGLEGLAEVLDHAHLQKKFDNNGLILPGF